MYAHADGEFFPFIISSIRQNSFLGICNYYIHNVEGYSCELLTTVTFSTPENGNYAITGNHLAGKNDDSVLFVIAKNSKMDYIPPAIIKKFKNLRSVDFSKSELKSITANTFRDGLNIKNFWLYENKLTSLPGNIFANTKVEFVDLQHNLINQISWNAFANSSNVNKINLNDNQLPANLDPRIFQNLPNLRELVLRDNQITDFAIDAFKNLQKLETLDLDWNRIRHLETLAFKPLTALKTLSLTENDIEDVEKDFFSALPKLENFRLTKNRCQDFEVNGIKNVNLEIVPRMEKCFNPKLKCQTTCKIIDEL